MNDFVLIFSTLVSGFLAWWFCGHCSAVARKGGPEGPDSKYYQRAGHPLRFSLYVAVFGTLGIASTTFAIRGLLRLWTMGAGA